MSVAACVMGHDERTEALDGILLCGRHRRRMDDDVTEIELLIVDTRRITDGGAPTESGPRVSHGKKRADPPAPGDVQIMTLFDKRNAVARIAETPQNPGGDTSEPVPAITAVVASWVLLVAEERPLTADLPKSVLAQLDLLRRHHEWIAAQPFVDDYMLELAELRKALISVVHDVRFERRGKCSLTISERETCGCYCHTNTNATCTINKNKPDEVPYCGPHSLITRVCGGVLLEENGTRAVRCVQCKARWVTDQELARLAVSQESA